MNTKNLLVGIGLCLLLACTEVDNKLEVNRLWNIVIARYIVLWRLCMEKGGR